VSIKPNQLKLNADQLPIIIYFVTKKGIIKEYVLKTNLKGSDPQSVLLLNKKE
jgi:hypothetical protein